MGFNSVAFGIFLPVVFCVYWWVLGNKPNSQNLFLLGASYVFYGWWDWRFLSLVLISSLVDYVVGLKLYACERTKQRKKLLYVSILVNLGLLGVFKYFDFFVVSLVEVFTRLGIHLEARTLNVILPVGISFYTFQTLSYTLDIYRRRIQPTRNIITFFAFVSFFPQLVAGPIERAQNLLPQFQRKRVFVLEEAKDGLRQILWGLFKKVVIADMCAMNVDFIFSNYNKLTGSMLWLGTIFFAFQIYGDFSGYSDIAIGTARLLGFNLMRNFAFPYFSRNIAEFWRRWHISLSSWFRDYVYIPLGGSHGNTLTHIRNVLITFTLSGFWHGANWTFIVWGFLNGAYYVPLILIKHVKEPTQSEISKQTWFSSYRELGTAVLTFGMTLIAWVFFRSQSLHDAMRYLAIMFSGSLFSIPTYSAIKDVLWIGGFACIEWCQRKKQHGLQFSHLPVFIRWGVYYTLVFLILRCWGNETPFIYFQF